jgi:hypothetical protein
LLLSSLYIHPSAVCVYDDAVGVYRRWRNNRSGIEFEFRWGVRLLFINIFTLLFSIRKKKKKLFFSGLKSHLYVCPLYIVDGCVCKGCTPHKKKRGEGIIIGYRGASLLQVTSRRRRQAYKEDKHHPKKRGRDKVKKKKQFSRPFGWNIK